MDPTPLVVVAVLTAMVAAWSWIASSTASAAKGVPVAQIPVAGLVDYCARVSAAIESNPTVRASVSGTISVPASSLPTGNEYANWASGPPSYTLQCWMVNPPAGGGLAAAIAAAPQNPTVGFARTPAMWVSVQGGQQQVMPRNLSPSQVGTVVVLSGY